MPEFRLPTTPEQWDRIKCEQINTTDLALEMECQDNLLPPRVVAAASRLLERERCERKLAEWLEFHEGCLSVFEVYEKKARHILEDAK